MSSVITTISLTRRFGPINAVNGVSLDVPQHSVYGFLGPNGAGKTTTIRMLLGLLKATAGEVHLFGSPFQASRSALLARIGSLVEMPSLYPHLTGRENLEVIRRMLALGSDSISRVLAVVDLENGKKGRGVGGPRTHPLLLLSHHTRHTRHKAWRAGTRRASGKRRGASQLEDSSHLRVFCLLHSAYLTSCITYVTGTYVTLTW